MLRSLLPLAVALQLTAPALGPFDLSLEPDANNLAQDRLAGTWVADPVVGARLGTGGEGASITFEQDPTILASIPARHGEMLSECVLYEAGLLTLHEEDELDFAGPYLLTNHCGNPHVIVFRERDGEPLADAESFNILLAPGKEPHQDLLLVGGDFDNEPMRAFRRAVERQ